jgi:outer membrane murein-binding lipoprotein Lpp
MMLFDNFIKHARETNEYPVLDFLHEEEQLRFGVADWLQRDGALYLASGTFDDTELAQAAIAGLEADPEYWGASISYRITEPPMLLVSEGQIPVFTNGINRYISIVPKRRAANLFTAISVIEEVRRMDKRAFDELVKLVGAEKAGAFAALVDDASRTIEEVGLVTRADVLPAEEPPLPEQRADGAETPPAEPAQTPEPAKPTLDELAAAVKELQAQVAELKANYGVMQDSTARATDEQKRAVTVLDDLTQRLMCVEALSTRWQQWLDDAPEHIRGEEHVVRARDTEPQPMTLAQIAEQNLSKMNRGPHTRRPQ